MNILSAATMILYDYNIGSFLCPYNLNTPADKFIIALFKIITRIFKFNTAIFKINIALFKFNIAFVVLRLAARCAAKLCFSVISS